MAADHDDPKVLLLPQSGGALSDRSGLASRRLPSIRELDLSYSKQTIKSETEVYPHHALASPDRDGLSPLVTSPKTPSMADASMAQERGLSKQGSRRNSVALAYTPDVPERFPTAKQAGSQLAPIRENVAQQHQHHAPQFQRQRFVQHIPPLQTAPLAARVHSRLAPSSPAEVPQLHLLSSGMLGKIDAATPTPAEAPSLTPNDEHQLDPASPNTHPDATLHQARRKRRESKERRRRKDQRSLTAHMEASVPQWVFNRLRTRHSASKVNGGGRATNAVISGACVWLRVQDRAMREGIAHWSLPSSPPSFSFSSPCSASASTISSPSSTHHSLLDSPGMKRWEQLVDEEASFLEDGASVSEEEDDGTSLPAGSAAMELD